MLNTLKELFERRLQPMLSGESAEVHQDAVQIAAAALMIEVARSDHDFDDTERETLKNIVHRKCELGEDAITELLEIAESEVENAVSLDQFTRQLNGVLSVDEKVKLMSHLWEMAYADGSLDKYEEYLMRKLADLLHVSHAQYIQTKLRALEDRE
ncbi:MAG: TerB family tellurite resistance protein [Gammaproteobacteria bacterium]|nr:TerB family tellurite resistance protein [Gammaproteobacteria bacterium]